MGKRQIIEARWKQYEARRMSERQQALVRQELGLAALHGEVQDEELLLPLPEPSPEPPDIAA
jgi:hypothetical protein